MAGAALIGAMVTEAATALLGVFADARAERRAQAVLAQQLAALVARAVADPSRRSLELVWPGGVIFAGCAALALEAMQPSAWECELKSAAAGHVTHAEPVAPVA